MKNKLLFNLLTPFATSNTEGKTFRNLLALVVVFILGVNGVGAQVSITSLPANYSNNFNSYNPSSLSTSTSTINSSGTSSSGLSSATTGWSTSSTNAVYNAQGTGTGNTGGFISYGTGTDFSIGALSSSSHTHTYTLSFTNNSGSTISSLTIAWDYEQWRYGAGNTSGWNCSGTGELASNSTLNGKDFSGVAGTTAGTTGGLTTAISSFTLTDLLITNGQSFGITWVTTNLSGSDNGVAIDNFTITASASPTSTTYTTSWSNSAPTSSIDATIDGDLTTSADLACKDLTINANRTLTIAAGYKLTVSGNLINNGTIVFKSDVNGTAMFGVFNGTQSGTGVVTTERYIPAKRAFRFLSPSVTTSTSIKLNWQENAGTTAGLGTHITGLDGATNGFDATGTNNPSMYTFTSGAWAAVTNTNVNVLTAGTPYRLMVRGDRLINLSTNTPTATETVLRATGTLKTGNFSPTLNQAAEGISFVGNPYQAPVNIKTVLDAATNMNTGVVYYWDPTLNARGGYVTRDLLGSNNNVTSNFTEFLQPGQAVFVKKSNTLSNATMTFTESNKAVANASAGVFRNINTSDYGLLRVNLQANTNNQWQTIEGTLALFNSGFNTAVTDEDATKMANLDEEVSFVQNNTSLAIACQPNPTATTELPIRLTNTRYTNYQWQFDLDNYDGATPYLFDTLNNSYTQINNGTLVPFTADSNATNRFKIVFQNAVLSNTAFQNTLAIYPNPAKAGASFYVEGISEATVTVSNLLGQNIQVQTKNQGTSLQVTPNTNLSQGVYLVNITTQGTTQQVKWIVE